MRGRLLMMDETAWCRSCGHNEHGTLLMIQFISSRDLVNLVCIAVEMYTNYDYPFKENSKGDPIKAHHRYSAPQSPTVKTSWRELERASRRSISSLSCGVKLKENTCILSSTWSVMPKRAPSVISISTFKRETREKQTDDNCPNKCVFQYPTCGDIRYTDTAMPISDLTEKD